MLQRAGQGMKQSTREIMFYCTLNSKYKNMEKGAPRVKPPHTKSRCQLLSCLHSTDQHFFKYMLNHVIL